MAKPVAIAHSASPNAGGILKTLRANGKTVMPYNTNPSKTAPITYLLLKKPIFMDVSVFDLAANVWIVLEIIRVVNAIATPISLE